MTLTIADIPSYDTFMWPIIERMKVHGRSMTNAEMDEDVATHMGLSDEQRAVEHGFCGFLSRGLAMRDDHRRPT